VIILFVILEVRVLCSTDYISCLTLIPFTLADYGQITPHMLKIGLGLLGNSVLILQSVTVWVKSLLSNTNVHDNPLPFIYISTLVPHDRFSFAKSSAVCNASSRASVFEPVACAASPLPPHFPLMSGVTWEIHLSAPKLSDTTACKGYSIYKIKQLYFF